MNIRQPVRAGSFYEASLSSCRHHAQKLLDAARLPADLPGRIFGGLVPHAGWMFSGGLAARTFKALAAAAPIETLVLFGA
ncbi:MAG TPA: AmmeMemoRadiSam system protein B, partial [Phycisphaerae bacterium]|nr:AmmeMemoRadiSam system protein B [Phycisphaerae bacterium]